MQPYFAQKDELSVHAGCLMWGARVIVPPQGRDEVMNILHDSHPGIVRMKGIARSHVWWPKMDQALEGRVNNCSTCQEHKKMPAPAPLHPWEWSSRPWTRIHIDYAGPFMGKMFLLIIDAHSKWLDVHCVNTATTETTITELRATFATHGIPEVIVSDNGTAFTSHEQGRREGGGQGGQNTWGPECSEGPGNLGKMFVLFIIALCLSKMKYAYLHTIR